MYPSFFILSVHHSQSVNSCLLLDFEALLVLYLYNRTLKILLLPIMALIVYSRFLIYTSYLSGYILLLGFRSRLELNDQFATVM